MFGKQLGSEFIAFQFEQKFLHERCVCVCKGLEFDRDQAIEICYKSLLVDVTALLDILATRNSIQVIVHHRIQNTYP